MKNRKIDIKKQLEVIENIRSISFRLDQSDVQLFDQSKRLNELLSQVEEARNLKSHYEQRAKEFSNKIDKLKLLSQQR
ncbi:hypothetical protein BVY03_02575 [bacterium K02(2017)]|nr:hypothetical protein BVY03_02575 [bacterium K02(2017)]